MDIACPFCGSHAVTPFSGDPAIAPSKVGTATCHLGHRFPIPQEETLPVSAPEVTEEPEESGDDGEQDSPSPRRRRAKDDSATE